LPSFLGQEKHIFWWSSQATTCDYTNLILKGRDIPLNSWAKNTTSKLEPVCIAHCAGRWERQAGKL